ncbi:MAG: methyltransferase domain-containing protein [Oscillospiraceae bacterium]|nr:methyltransferase domain-containing protein [Oscillospiraceae bacterium]
MTGQTQRIKSYWTARAHDFAAVRVNELHDAISDRWTEEICARLPGNRPLDILDAGTGTGYFAVLLSRLGHRLTGIDLTPAMLDEADRIAGQAGVSPTFLVMDAQALRFDDAVFDAVVTRNLTWTLPDPEQAYREWFRVLRPGGVLLNFDADYAQNVRNENQKASETNAEGVYGHIGITPALSRENAEITLSMPAAGHRRPEWDAALAKEIGFAACGADLAAGARILRERDLADAPLFLFWAVKG